MNTWKMRAISQIRKKTHKWTIAKMIVCGRMRMASRSVNAKARSKSKCSNKNLRAKWTGQRKKLSEWLKSPVFPKAKSTSGVGTRKRKTWSTKTVKKEKWSENNLEASKIRAKEGIKMRISATSLPDLSRGQSISKQNPKWAQCFKKPTWTQRKKSTKSWFLTEVQ